MRTQVRVAVCYEGEPLQGAYAIDILVEEAVVIELKAVDDFHPRHFAQIKSYLRLGGFPVGLLLNFGAPRLRDGIHRVVMTS